MYLKRVYYVGRVCFKLTSFCSKSLFIVYYLFIYFSLVSGIDVDCFWIGAVCLDTYQSD